MFQLDAVVPEVLLDLVLYLFIFESSLQLGHCPLAFEELHELVLNEHQDPADVAVGHFGGDLDLVAQGGRRGVAGLVLRDVLAEHVLIEADRIHASLVVVEFSVALGLDDVGLAGRGGVVERVSLDELLGLEYLFVLPGGVLLGDQAARWGLVRPRGGLVKLTQQFVKFLFVALVLVGRRGSGPLRRCRALGKQFVELFFDLGCFGFELWVSELVARGAFVHDRLGGGLAGRLVGR